MRILVLGGTWFLGRAVAQAALDRGWSVSTFTRGRSGPAPRGAQEIHGDRTVRADLTALAEHGPWDAVVDTSSGQLPPRDVLAGAQALAPVTSTYVYVSTVNAYRDWPDQPLTESSELLEAPADADADYGRLPPDWGGPDWYYGRQKAGAERAATAAFGTERVSILRPGVILGPGEYVGRLPWWLQRAQRGGTILAPGPPDATIQPVDVRDVAAFALDRAAAQGGGAFNVTAPGGRETMHGFLTACLNATGSNGRLAWAPPDLLQKHKVQQWTELPLWRTHTGVWNVDSTRAHTAGLQCRPLAETVTDTWAWMRNGGRPVPHPRASEHGISTSKETAILERLKA